MTVRPSLLLSLAWLPSLLLSRAHTPESAPQPPSVITTLLLLNRHLSP